MEKPSKKSEILRPYRSNQSLPLMRIFSLDLPYNFRIPEDVYNFEYEGIKFSMSLSKVQGEGYTEEEPLDETQVRSSSMDVRGLPEGGSRYELVNMDPVDKGYRFKYTRLRIVCLDPKQELNDSKLVDAINKFIRSYVTYVGDPVVSEIRREDFFMFHEVLLDSLNNGYILSLHLGDPKKHDAAIVLSDESKEEFKQKLDESPTSSSIFFHKARHLLSNGYPSAAILYAEKSMECLLEELLDRNMTDEKEEFLSYIGRTDLDKIKPRMQVLSLLVGKKLTYLKEYAQYAEVRSNHRNELFHSDHEVTEEDADEYLDKARNLRLALLTNIADGDDLHTSPPEFEYLNGKKVKLDMPDLEFEDSFEKLPEIKWPNEN